MKKRFLVLFLPLISILFADLEMGCSVSDILETPKNSLLETMGESNCTENKNEAIRVTTTKTLITEKLMSIKVLHEKEIVLIERELLKSAFSCPPFCIQPMNIKGVETVAELEVLAFINKLKEKKARLMIDVRESTFYEDGTIPGAINLPFSMLKDESKYQEEVLKLLGARLSGKGITEKWSFENAQFLLIFGKSVITSEASNAVNQLLNLGYPSTKLLYYRSGIESWNALGLTTY